MPEFHATRLWLGLVGLALCLGVAGFASTLQPPPFDVVVRNGEIFDGSGNASYRADIGIKDGKIAAIGRKLASGKSEIDASNCFVSPGFIDVHTHAEGVIPHRNAENFLRMGVTSIVIGNCGSSESDLGAFFEKLEKDPASINVASLVGHNTVRRAAMKGNFNRPPSADELESMRLSVRRAMEQGAVGLSTGLIYLPGTYSKQDEIAELAKVVAEFDGIYASHMRNESRSIVEAIQELLYVARESGCRAELSHIKLGGEVMWGKHKSILELLDKARKDGIEITQDQYAYPASSTSLSVIIPDAYLDGGVDKFNELVKNPEIKEKVVQEIKANLKARGRDDFAYVVIADFKADRSLNGKDLVTITKQQKAAGTLDDQIDMIFSMLARGGASCVFFGMSEEDVRGFMAHPNTMFASDSGIRVMGEGVPHPRGYGNNARILQKYVREEGVLSWSEAIRKMTSLPAQTFRLNDRGLLKLGLAADLVVFDPKAVKEVATYDDPHHYAEGFKSVIVNGVEVVSNDRHLGTRPGMPLRHRSNLPK